MDGEPRPVVLVTGAARRVGAVIAEHLAVAGWTLALHYRHSAAEMQQLLERLRARGATVEAFQADLLDAAAPAALVQAVQARFGRLDGLVHNASSFYPTPLGTITTAQFDDLIGSNARAPLLLSQAAAPLLAASGRGAIVSLVDIYAERPLPRYLPYCMAKAALVALTLGLARALGPAVRVNAVAPGNILWSDNPEKADTPQEVRERTALARSGEPADVARAVAFLLREPYITGEILRVDGGRWLQI